MTLWVYGDSNSASYGLSDEDQGWPCLVAQHLGHGLVNRARPAVDNFFIYQSWLQDRTHISSQDLVVIGWSHYSRKMFVKSALLEIEPDPSQRIISYKDHDRIFFRGDVDHADSASKYQRLAPRDSGIDYFDRWFHDYYNEYEQQTNLQSYIDSVNTHDAETVQFFFSTESVKNLQVPGNPVLCILDFILENQLTISNDDCHANTEGHRQWAKIIIEQIHARNSRLF